MRRLFAFLIGVLWLPSLAGAIMAGEFDDFQSGSLEGWGAGSVSNPNPPVNQADQGPLGAGDRALLVTANGDAAGAGGKLVVLNRAQWAGDYLAAGVTEIELDLLNLSSQALTVRLALKSGLDSFASVDEVVLPAEAETYTRASLSVRPEDLVLVEGGGNAMSALADVTELRILHSVLPDLRGDVVVGQLAIDNLFAVTGGELDCASDFAKADVPADFLLLPGFEVDTETAGGLTTFFSVHNQTDESRVARVRYFDASGILQNQVDLDLEPRQTRTTNIQSVDGLPVDDDGFARGAVKVFACSDSGGDLDSALSGDYLFLDNANNFATGDQLLRREDICQTAQVRLLNFGSGIRLRLYSSDPQGPEAPTATYTVFNEAGGEVESGSFIADETVEIFNTSVLTPVNFGTLVVEFVEGGGALSVEYSAFGRFSVAMNATCVVPLGE